MICRHGSRVAAATAGFLLSTPHALAYEIKNHLDMTTAAFKASVLMSDPSVLEGLGLTGGRDTSDSTPIGPVTLNRDRAAIAPSLRTAGANSAESTRFAALWTRQLS
jgi:hypothetical protein